MIKGVNKNIIEICDTGSECFERVILFVRPDSIEKDRDQLCRKAMSYLASVKIRPRIIAGKRRLVLQIAKWCGAAAVGAALAFVLLQMQ